MLELVFLSGQTPATVGEKPLSGIFDHRGALEPQPIVEVRFFDGQPPMALYSTAHVDLPPQEFDRPADNVVVDVQPAKVAEQCGHEGNAQACVLVKPNFEGDKCFVLLPSVGRGGVTQKTQDLLRRHEYGWEHKP